MKLSALIIAALLSATAFAQSPEALSKGLKNYERALKSERTPMVASAIFHVAKLKLLFPAQNTERVERQLVRLMKNSNDETIRYKAYLAVQLLQHPQDFAAIEKKDYKQSEALFVNISNEMQRQLLAAE